MNTAQHIRGNGPIIPIYHMLKISYGKPAPLLERHPKNIELRYTTY